MNETIERVAREMCAADGFDPDSDIRQLKNGGMLDISIQGPPERWRTYANRALAAIKAMRIPSTAAIKAGAQKCSDDPVGALDVWEAMIDAALRDADAPRQIGAGKCAEQAALPEPRG